MQTRTRMILVGVVLLAMAGGTYAAWHVWRIRHDYGVVAWSPSGPTPQIPFQERTYLLGQTPAGSAIPAGAELLGTIDGGGEVYGVAMPCCAPTAVFVRYPDGTVASYALSGGP